MFGFENGKGMKVKLLLKFYFNAASLNEWMDKLITYNACKTEGSCFDRIVGLIEDKSRLCSLMDYLESRFDRLTHEDSATLKEYVNLRTGIRNLENCKMREIKRAVMKFTRKLTFIERHKEEILILKKYRAVLQ